jgi:hypothetical protein
LQSENPDWPVFLSQLSLEIAPKVGSMPMVAFSAAFA